MAAILVNYDLNAPGRRYAELVEVLKSGSSWAHLGGSSWVVTGPNLTPVSVREAMVKVIDGGDTISTVDITACNYTGMQQQQVWDWLRLHVRVPRGRGAVAFPRVVQNPAEPRQWMAGGESAGHPREAQGV